MTIYAAAITLILVIDPLGNVPMFLSILNGIEHKKRQKIILRETFMAFLFLVAFLFFGKFILKGMQLSDVALSLSGGIILFLIALRMIFPSANGYDYGRPGVEPFIVPLAVPLIAGPSSMTVVMLLANQTPHQMGHWLLALIIATACSTVILLFADVLRAILGESGLIAVERLMGLILTTMAVQMVLTGIQKFLHMH